MFSASLEIIDKIISRPDHIINFCILAHVDHGKTTLCDHLLATNGIISKDLAGQIRYMDCLPAERDRNITMKTSSVSLLYRKENEVFYLTVVDSPGHVDFEAEVSNAVRLSDGCLVLVDAVEGVCVQTELVLHSAFENKLTPILVINKVDRLFTELSLDPDEAELYLQKLLTEVNAATLQENPPFDPCTGNVIFASCIGKWGISIPDISSQWSEKLGVTNDKAADLFWGLKYWNPQTKLIVKKKPSPNSRTFFSQVVLTPIWRAHQTGTDVQSFAQKLGITPTSRENCISVLSKWAPLSNALLGSVTKLLPTPLKQQANSVSNICPQINQEKYLSFFESTNLVDMNGPTLAFGPKIVHGGVLRFPSTSFFPYVMYLRVYSGTISIGDKLYIKHPSAEIETTIVESLYLFMGNELIKINKARAGCIVGIGFRKPVLKQSTLSSVSDFPEFLSTSFNAQPIVKVSIEAKHLHEQSILVNGALLLSKIDPAVSVMNEENGQLTLCAMGEVHLDYCLDEMRSFLAKVEFFVSPPLVPCQETIIKPRPKPKSVTMGLTTVTASSYKLKQEVIDVIQTKNQWEIQELRDALVPIIGEKANTIISTGPSSKCSNLLFCPDTYCDLFHSLTAGFLLCVSQGPLCEEPMYGIGFIVNSIEIKQLTLAYLLQDDDESMFAPSSSSPLQFGETIACAKEAFRQTFLESSPRIMEPVYKCSIQCDFSAVGRTYDILNQHRCEILDEKPKENSNHCIITCLLPVIESFGFPNDLRSKTSGKSHPQLSFSHFKLVEDDPFWKPKTQEELEEYGEKGKELKPNVSKIIIESVRKRKGIWTENIEQKSDKRATMTKMK